MQEVFPLVGGPAMYQRGLVSGPVLSIVPRLKISRDHKAIADSLLPRTTIETSSAKVGAASVQAGLRCLPDEGTGRDRVEADVKVPTDFAGRPHPISAKKMDRSRRRCDWPSQR